MSVSRSGHWLTVVWVCLWWFKAAAGPSSQPAAEEGNVATEAKPADVDPNPGNAGPNASAPKVKHHFSKGGCSCASVARGFRSL